MSTFGGQRPTSISRNFAPRGPVSRRLETLDVANLSFVPPAFQRGANLAEQLAATLGVVNQGLGHAADVAVEDRRERERLDREAASLHRGNAARDAELFIIEQGQRIADGKLAPPFGTETRDFAESLVSDSVTGMPAPYAERYREIVLPALVRDLTRRSASEGEKFKDSTLNTLAAAAAGRTDPAEIEALVTDGRDRFGLDENALRRRLGIEALRFAAETGDETQLAAARTFLGDREPVAQVEAAAALKSTRDRQARQVRTEFEDRIAGMRLDGQTPDAIIDYARAQRGRIDDETVGRVVDAAEAEKARRAREVAKSITEQVKGEAFESIIGAAQDVMSRGDVTGGSAAVDDVTIELPDGTTATVTGREIIAEATRREFERVDALTTDPEARLQHRVRWLSANPQATNPEWARAFAGVADRLPVDATDETVPPVAVRSLQLYRELRAKAPAGVVSRHLSESDEAYLSLVNAYFEEHQDVTPGAAMMIVRKAAAKTPVPELLARRISRDALESESERLLKGSANGVDALAAIERKANLYMQVGAVANDEAAARRAVSDFRRDYSQINGYWVRTRGRPIVNAVDLDAVGSIIVNHYASTQGPNERPELFSLVPFGERSWVVSLQANGRPSPGSPVYTDADLGRIHASLQDAESENKRRAIAAKHQADQRDRIAWARRQFSDSPLFGEQVFRPGGGRRVDVIALQDAPDSVQVGPILALPSDPVDAPHLSNLLEFVRSQRLEAARAAAAVRPRTPEPRRLSPALGLDYNE